MANGIYGSMNSQQMIASIVNIHGGAKYRLAVQKRLTNVRET
jgi:hypothetical protein